MNMKCGCCEPWEWQPLERMPDGCCEVVVRYIDGETAEMCSCDYWWGVSQSALPDATSFRYCTGDQTENEVYTSTQ